jgi:hypothetical protein
MGRKNGLVAAEEVVKKADQSLQAAKATLEKIKEK